VQVAVCPRENDEHLLFHRQRHKLILLEHLRKSLAARELRLGGSVQFGTKLREGRQLAILREIQPQRSGNLPHGFDLRVAAHAAHRETHVNGRPDATVEEIGFQINLAVSNGNDVSRDVSRYVAGLRFDHRQSRERTATFLVVQFGGALQQTRVQIKNVAGKSFAPRRASQKERDFAIGLRVLREIVIETDRMAARIPEEFAYSAGGIGGNVLHGGGFGGGSGHDDGVVHGARIGQDLYHLRDGRALLPDGAVDADHVAALLVDDGVQNDGGLARLPVADDQFALAAADGNHRVDGLDAGLQGLANRLAVHDAWRDALDGVALLGSNRSLAVEWHAQRIDHASDERVSNGRR